MKNTFIYLLGIFVFSLMFYSCASDGGGSKMQDAKFELVPSSHSNIDFKNVVDQNVERNWMTFSEIFNGGGVSIGDINNDGLADIFFTGNETQNKLYLNKGDMVFEDITEKAKLGDPPGWNNGVNMVDINGDGFLDIYVCRGGWTDLGKYRFNLLYINNGDLTFSEKAGSYGINDLGYSFQSNFFDYDGDNDLDLYLINHPAKSHLPFEANQEGLINGSTLEKDKLYRNNGNGTFSDVTETAGLGKTFGFGLSVTTADFDGNGYQDIYVGNDYSMPDHMWMNNGDGTFNDRILDAMEHIPYYSMGTDVADFNNDLKEDILTVEMLPTDYKMSKTSMLMVEPHVFEYMVENDYHHQYMHNMLQMNNGHNKFSEVSQMAGVSKSDWSWAPFMEDFNNDGNRDLFISNGYRRFTLERDLNDKILKYIEDNGRQPDQLDEFDIVEINNLMGTYATQNQFYQNNGDLTFSNRSNDLLPQKLSYSNGAAIADLDNDGDIDIVCNNIDEEAMIYENKLNPSKKSFVKLKLKGPKLNSSGIGSKITIQHDGKKQFFQFKTTRGFLSSVDHLSHFGLGNTKTIESIEVVWPDGAVSTVLDQKPGGIIEVDYSLAKKSSIKKANFEEGKAVKEITFKNFKEVHKHEENRHADFAKQVLLPHKMSALGPFISVGDINGDKIEDVFIGGASGHAGKIYYQSADGLFLERPNECFEKDKVHEDMGSVFFDAENDGDLDLYVVSGGTEKLRDSIFYNDRIYLNNGRGIFERYSQVFPIQSSGARVVSADYDNDGDTDFFVGGRVTPGFYPMPPNSHLINNYKLQFGDVSDPLGPNFQSMGMVTDGIWVDLDKDGYQDLITVGEWMPIKVYKSQDGNLIEKTGEFLKERTDGWWNCIQKVDVDNDGDLDFIVGNLGLNYKFKASIDHPFEVYVNDYDMDGTLDVILSKEYDGKKVPVRGKQCMSEQIPFVGHNFSTFEEFADADLMKILGPKFKESQKLEAVNFASSILYNDGDSLRIEALPLEAQISPINSVITHDFNGDGRQDLIIAGNMYGSEVETTRADAGVGLVLINRVGGFEPMSPAESGLYLNYDVKDMKKIKLVGGKDGLLVSCNDDILRLYELKKYQE